jgi:hypothetical protein
LHSAVSLIQDSTSSLKFVDKNRLQAGFEAATTTSI